MWASVQPPPPAAKANVNRVPQPGARYGRWTVIALAPRLSKKNRNTRVEARCDCGTVASRSFADLRSGHSQSCGCMEYRNGMLSHGRTGTPAHRIWRGIITRCTNRRHHSWPYYGGRGITVCDRWRGPDGFVNFLADMGERPSSRHSIDRIDNDGNYEPGNCRWATFVEQMRNRSTSKLTPTIVSEIRGRREHGESTRSIARRLGMPVSTVEKVASRTTWSDVP